MAINITRFNLRKFNSAGFGLIGIIVAIAAIAALAGAGWYWEKMQVQRPQMPPAQQTNQPDVSTWKTYRSEKYGFEVRYPADKLQVTTITSRLPHANQPRFDGVEFFHSTPTGKTPQDTCYHEYSGIPYSCQSEVKDTSFYFFVVSEKYEVYVSRYEADLVETIGGKRWIIDDIGFEGDGSLYYLAPKGDDQTLIISRAYKNEFDNKRHGDHDELLFSQVFSTLKFTE
ncbi:MAG: hypothetical protein HY454_04030 [Parcubacteria group bacterium]|nr:hypothetical protein [Parcubacteria group bacterium]